jgi:hypothetical protein
MGIVAPVETALMTSSLLTPVNGTTALERWEEPTGRLPDVSGSSVVVTPLPLRVKTRPSGVG